MHASRPRRAAAEAVYAGLAAMGIMERERPATTTTTSDVRAPTVDAYWARDDSRQRFGILEVDMSRTGCDARHLFVRSVFWGLRSLLEAEALACIGNNVMASYDDAYPVSGPLAQQQQQQKTPRQTRQQRRRLPLRALVPYACPREHATFVLAGHCWLIPVADFAVAHRPNMLQELASVFHDIYRVDLKRADATAAKDERKALLHMLRALEEHTVTLPLDMVEGRAYQAPGCFVQRIS